MDRIMLADNGTAASAAAAAWAAAHATRRPVDAPIVVMGFTPGREIPAATIGLLAGQAGARVATPVVLVPDGWTDDRGPVTVGIARDGSSDAALAFAAREALTSGAVLQLVHAWLMPTPRVFGPTALRSPRESIVAEHQEALSHASRWVAEQHPSIAVNSEMVRESRSTALLRDASRSSLLVVGTHRRDVRGSAHLSATTQEILWQARCPVAVVPAH